MRAGHECVKREARGESLGERGTSGKEIFNKRILLVSNQLDVKFCLHE